MSKMAAPTATLPPQLAGKFKGSFAYNTIKDKLPVILNRVINNLEQHKNEFFEEHGEKGIEAQRKVIVLLTKLRDELQADKPLTALNDSLPDTTLWNQCLEYHQKLSDGPPSWFQSPWLYTECYMYRRIHEALAQNTYLQELLKNIKGLDEKSLKEEFLKLLQGAHNYFLSDVPVTREQLCHYRNAAETARSELAALLVKYECSQAELQDLKSKIASKEVSVQELKADVESYKENDARQSSLLLSMQSRLQEIEKESGTIAFSKKQTDLKAQAILQENLELKEKTNELESQVRTYLNESNESKTQASKASRVHNEFIAHLCHFFDMSIVEKEEPREMLLSKISDMHEENKVLKRQIATLQETTNVHDMESKANRETIMRLVSELSKEQRQAASCCQDMEKLSNDLSSTTAAKQSLEREIRTLQERLAASQRAWEVSQEEMSHLKKCCHEKEENLKTSVEEVRAEKSLHDAFKEQIITLLGSSCFIASRSEEDIVEKIREMIRMEESKKTMVSQLENQIAKLTEALETQAVSHQEVLQRTKKAENKSETLHNQLMCLEAELVSGDVIRDALKLEKQKYFKFLDQLSEKMNLDRMAADIGFDMRLDAVLARVDQLIKLEGDTLTENKIMARNLQRKLRTQKEQLDSKELHMKLLRQKIAQLEEEKQVRTALAVERDDANLMVRKLQKKVDRLQNELVLARETNTDLKAKLADTNELKIRTLEQDRTIEDLSKSQEKLERMKAKAEKQLTSVKSELHDVEREAKDDKEKARSRLESVTSELGTLKSTLQAVMKREKQLADFREVVSRMLGLNIATIALPDYEIITRLEGLIHSHPHHFVPCVCFKDMSVRKDGSLQLLH
ncbi:coiled-coil domain-containing protein 170-like isoform X3 [Lacerta agilis]|uniref:coiled-coil domain-containing protein 170-like isoform X3 n=1 Tax=Lacerta agilis TaxID=80427 RepID=UPI00141A1C10|nr:coiled-coil domain-containing protein 170-like isoform X3 [Lacerta agilis]